MKRMIVLCLAACACTVAGLSLAHSDDSNSWPQWRGPNRDGLSTSKGLLKSWEDTKPKLQWMSEGVGSGYASVSIADGKIFTTGNTDQSQAVIALSLNDGSVLWKQPITDGVPGHDYSGSRSTPTFSEGLLYVVSSDGQIVCLNSRDGKIVWKKDFKEEWAGRMMSSWGYSESPLVDGNRVLCTPGGSNAAVVCLNKKTGKEIWRCKPDDFGDGRNHSGRRLRGGAGYSSIVISNGAGVKQYVQLTGSGVIGIRARDGKFQWGYDDVANGIANVPTPIVRGDYIFCSTGYQTGSALLKLSKRGNSVQAEEVYFLGPRKLQNHHGGLLLIGDHVFGGHGHNQGRPICVDLESGEVAWGGNIRGPGKRSAAVTYADGHLIFRYENGIVALIEANPESYQLKGSFKPEFQQGQSWAHPVVFDGRLYLREQDKLMCYDLRAGS